MLDHRKPTNSIVSSSVPDDFPNLSRRGFLEMSAATAFLFGFCVPLRATRAAADAAMAGNICRCGTYVRIREAIKNAAGDGQS